MRTIEKLQDEKSTLESRLKSITSYHEDGTPYYIDEEMAQMIKEQIGFLDMSIENLGKEIRDLREKDEEHEQILRRKQRDTLVSDAKSFYEKQIQAYMSLSFWQKAIAMFSGKKPKKLTDREILEVYGQNALERLIDDRISDILKSKEEQLLVASGMYDTDSKDYAYAVKAIESLYEDKIERIKEGYESELETAIRSSSSRRGMR